MRDISGSTQQALQRLRQSSAYVTALADAILIGRASNRVNAMGLFPAALRQLRDRVQTVIDAWVQEFGGTGN